MTWSKAQARLSAFNCEIASETQLTLFLVELQTTCQAFAFAREETARVATAASELARNILKYAGRGRMSCRFTEKLGQCQVEVTAQDSGPGIADLDLAVTDHYSSSGTLGLGLPGVKRLTDGFQIESTVGQGTRVRFQVVVPLRLPGAAP